MGWFPNFYLVLSSEVSPKYLVQKGADIDILDVYGKDALDWAKEKNEQGVAAELLS